MSLKGQSEAIKNRNSDYVSGRTYKELGSRHSHFHNKRKAEETKSTTLLDPTEN